MNASVFETYRKLELRSHTHDFSSNDYLGLSRDAQIRTALIADLKNGCPLGSTGSRLLSGNTIYHERVESFLAETFRVPSALLFSSGYMANVGVLSALGRNGAIFFSDELNHASLIDGARLAKTKTITFRHNDMDDLENQLKASGGSFKVIVTESVFSMDGDLAPIEELIELARRYSACLVIDEAHATGVFGLRGLGRLDGIDTSGIELISIHTGGKALGGQGAFVLSSQLVREFLINTARTFIFTTALAPLSALQIEHAVKAVMREASLRYRVLENSKLFRIGLSFFGLKVNGESQIVPLVLGSNRRVLQAQQYLQEQGFDIRAIRSPTVAVGTERLRVTLKSFHKPEDLAALIAALDAVCCR